MSNERCPEYLAWVRTLPCLVCDRQSKQQTSRTDAHHYGPRAYGTKASDYRAVPLCHVEHHQYGRYAVHVLGKRFAEHHDIDVHETIAALNAEYHALHA